MQRNNKIQNRLVTLNQISHDFTAEDNDIIRHILASAREIVQENFETFFDDSIAWFDDSFYDMTPYYPDSFTQSFDFNLSDNMWVAHRLYNVRFSSVPPYIQDPDPLYLISLDFDFVKSQDLSFSVCCHLTELYSGAKIERNLLNEKSTDMASFEKLINDLRTDYSVI